MTSKESAEPTAIFMAASSSPSFQCVKHACYQGVCTSSDIPTQLIPGHEVVGRIARVGKNVVDFSPEERVVADPSIVVRMPVHHSETRYTECA